ncbi:MAG: family 16 glycosylhydrolase [Ignavibacteriae bacterium]|nr:family 16 glycosylhydrolase [Ignavibacteriota bacterium]MCB9259976.1 family 16 glycosylhydrolase [Ignavibacteriales bacterium]
MNKKIILVYLLVSISITFGQDYQIIWSDEFNGRTLDENIWIRETGGNGWGNEEIQYYTNRDTNAYIENGKLIIKALKESFQGKSYTSARLITKDNKYFKYGKIEARIKLPYGQGIWPAFWMLGQNINSVGWPACGEIDIMEMIGGGIARDNKIYGTAHWEQNGHASYGGSYTLTSGIFADDFHTFTVEWSPQFIKWFIDGKQYHVIDITPSGLSEFHENFFIIFNIAVGGIWPGYPDSTTVFPQLMEVDYVRVYQKTSSLPNITLVEPHSNNFLEFSDIKISTEVEANSSIEKVEFFQDQIKIGETSVEPYEMIWRNIFSGKYNIWAKAITDEGFSSNSNLIEISVGDVADHSPYSGSAIIIPGNFEAEDFDIGGEGISYHDNSLNNEGFSYRENEGVDIEICLDENGGFNIGWTEPGEWFSYIIDTKQEGEFELTIRVASPNEGGSFSIAIDDQVLDPIIVVPNTGDWQNWISVKTNIVLTTGIHNFKVIIENGDFNINSFELYQPGTTPSINLIYPNGGENFEVGSIQEIRWNQLMIDNINLGLSLDNGNNWSFLAKDVNAKFGSYRWLVPDTPSDNCIIMIVDESNTSINDLPNSTFSIGSINSTDNKDKIIDEFYLYQNYPNPFNPETTIEYSIPFSGNVKLSLFDNIGQELKILVDEYKSSGKYSYKFKGNMLSSGIYFYQLSVGDFKLNKKMLLLK